MARFRSHATPMLLAVLSALLVAPAACHPDRLDDPIPIMLDRERGVTYRLTAAQQLGSVSQAESPARYREALNQLAWSDHHPIELRRYAIDRLIEHDPAAFQRSADRRIAQVQAWPALEYIFEQAAAHDLREFTRTAVRSYARPSIRYADHQRPEHKLIAALHPDRPVEAVIYEAFMAQAEADTAAHQVAAWTVLARLLEEPALRARLDAAPPATPVVADLQAAAALLDVLPRGREQLLWLARLRRADDGNLWSRAAERVEDLSPAQRRGLALRHLPLLAHTETDDDVRALRSRLASRARVTRIEGVPEDWHESFGQHREALPWGDQLAIQALLDVLETGAVRAALFDQAEHDRTDTRSEHGGAFTLTGDVKPFAPALRLHDRRFVASQQLIKRLHTALAHYHFHAQQHDNGAYAGPGPGDLAFAERFAVHAVVLTFVDRDTLNVDYYQPGGIVVDLGNLRRDEAHVSR